MHDDHLSAAIVWPFVFKLLMQRCTKDVRKDVNNLIHILMFEIFTYSMTFPSVIPRPSPQGSGN